MPGNDALTNVAQSFASQRRPRHYGWAGFNRRYLTRHTATPARLRDFHRPSNVGIPQSFRRVWGSLGSGVEFFT